MTDKSIARLLTGTSVVALAVGLALGSAKADHVVNPNPGGPYTNAGDIDYLFIDVDHDTITNEGTIEPGWSAPHDAQADPYPDPSEAVGITVDGADIDGDIINTVDGVIMIEATETAIGILVENGGDVTGSIINNGLIDVTASGPGAIAGGVVEVDQDDEAVFVNSLTGVVNVTAFHSDVDAVAATAIVDGAAGVYQEVASVGDATATISNSGTVDVDATAVATSTGGFADADVGDEFDLDDFVYGFHQQATGDGDSLASVDNDGDLTVSVLAEASGTSANAEVWATVAGINQEVSGDDSATATVNNSGTVAVDVTARGIATDFFAEGDVEEPVFGIHQDVDSLAGTAQASVVNDGALGGSITVDVLGEATGVTGADADVDDTVAGIFQNVFGDEDATALVDNSGTIAVNVTARAVATDGDADAEMDDGGRAYGIYQDVFSDFGDALASVDNSGSLTVTVLAEATGVTSADADLDAVYGIDQDASGENATATVTNDGTIAVSATARATATDGEAFADIDDDVDGINQDAFAALGDAAANVDNAGTLTVTALAEANGATSASATIDALMDGIDQDVTGEENATATVTNTGTITVSATARAISADGDAEADVNADIIGIDQNVFANLGDALASVANDDTLTVTVLAEASGTSASASVSDVIGIDQSVSATVGDATATVTNTGTIAVTATARATATEFDADAEVDDDVYGIYQDVDAGGDALASVDNQNILTVAVLAEANGVTSASASVAETVAGIYQTVDGDNATATVSNSGTLSVSAAAQAIATEGEAFAEIDDDVSGVHQEVDADLGDALASVVNDGSLTVTVLAEATGVTDASAEAQGTIAGIYQEVDADENATATVTNTGTIAVSVTARGTASEGPADGDVEDDVFGIYQDVNALSGDALASVDNQGSLTVTVLGEAMGTAADADVDETVAGIYQDVSADAGGSATASVDNSGTIAVDVTTRAIATDGLADADMGEEIFGIYQEVDAFEGDALADVDNSGTLTVSALAFASGTSAVANFDDTVAGIYQNVFGDQSATASVNNDGIIDVDVDATAIATDGDAFAANAVTTGIRQEVSGNGDLLASIVNHGDVSVQVSVNAEATGDAEAIASAGAGRQVILGSGTYVFENTGLFEAEAVAAATGDVAHVSAFAFGERMAVPNTETAVVDFFNSGTISARAEGVAVGDTTADSTATAFGYLVRSQFAPPNAGGGIMQGLVHNTGTVRAEAIASATADEVADADAFAIGMRFQVDQFDATLLNEGADAAIIAYAEAFADAEDADADAFAIGVRFEGGGGQHIDPNVEGLLINNSGMIWAGQSIDGGETITRGVAIDTRRQQHLIHQQWMGEEHWGRIFGDVNIKEIQGVHETITVSDGVTKLNGIVNNDGALVGEMTIEDSGTLFLAMFDPMVADITGDPFAQQEAPQVNVDTFIQEDGAQLWFEINAPENGTTVQAGPPDDFIGQVRANEVVLDGDAVLRVVTPQVFPDSFRYENVIVAEVDGSGAWDSVTSWSPLLDPTADMSDWDPGNPGEVHIDVNRVAFDEADLSGVGGFTTNKLAVAADLEANFEAVLDGDTPEDFELLVGTLFTLNDEEFRRALNQLEGSIHPQALWSVTNSLDLFKRAENARTKYGVVVPFGPPAPVYDRKMPGLPPAVGPAPAAGALWLNAQGTWGEVDGDENAPGFDHDRRSIHAGLDYMVTPGLILGVAGGYYSADLDFDNGAGEIDYDGFQIGGYGKYDWDNWYLNALVAYGNYSGDSDRNVVIDRDQDPMECGCIADVGLASTNKGDFDADAWMVSGEVGHRIHWSPTGWIAPYAGITYQRGSIDSFTEDGNGTALNISGADGESIVSDLGVRLSHGFAVGANSMANVELRAAWLHDFGDKRYDVDAAFDGVAGSGFRVVGSEISRDTLAFDAGLSFAMTQQIEVGVSYNGRFNPDVTDHGIMGRGVFKF